MVVARRRRRRRGRSARAASRAPAPRGRAVPGAPARARSPGRRASARAAPPRAPTAAGAAARARLVLLLPFAVALAGLAAAVDGGFGEVELVLDDAALVGVLQALLEHGDGLGRATGQAQRVAEVEQCVRARVGRRDRAVLDGLAEHLDRPAVVALCDEAVSLRGQRGLVGRRRRGLRLGLARGGCRLLLLRLVPRRRRLMGAGGCRLVLTVAAASTTTSSQRGDHGS